MSLLDVWLYEQKVGQLEQRQGELSYRYATDWVQAKLPPLSHSLPVRTEPFEGELVHSFFSNLLPEGEVRQLVARRFGVSVGNDFALLEAIGGDCAGAVSLTEPGTGLPAGSEEVRWLSDEELVLAVAELPTRPLLTDPDEGVRLSLAGAQDKFPVVYRGGRFGIPLGSTPSTHIVKTPIGRLDDTVVNEAFCLRFAAEMGLHVASADVHCFGEKEVLLVQRYDRVKDGEFVRRLHQEDFCQALGVPPERKYQSEGGPGLSESIGLIRSVSDEPARDVLRFVDAVAFNFLIGNHDAHAKNFSLLFTETGVSQAPLYDLICTVAYPGLSRKMAMAIGGEYRPDYLRSRHVERFAHHAGLGAAALRVRVRELATKAHEVARGVANELRQQGFDPPILDRVLATVSNRAKQLESELSSP